MSSVLPNCRLDEPGSDTIKTPEPSVKTQFSRLNSGFRRLGYDFRWVSRQGHGYPAPRGGGAATGAGAGAAVRLPAAPSATSGYERLAIF